VTVVEKKMFWVLAFGIAGSGGMGEGRMVWEWKLWNTRCILGGLGRGAAWREWLMLDMPDDYIFEKKISEPVIILVKIFLNRGISSFNSIKSVAQVR
jgi:hypothetical protein